MTKLTYFCDTERHLVCAPYSKANLHQMAKDLGIKRCWYHNCSYPHYDIPSRRYDEIRARCTLIPTRKLLEIITGERQ